jgi:hypothetical protein
MNGSAVLATRVGINGQKLHTNFITLRNPEINSVPLCYWLLIQLRCSPSETDEYISFEYTPNKAKNTWTNVFMLTCWNRSWLVSLPCANGSRKRKILKNALCLFKYRDTSTFCAPPPATGTTGVNGSCECGVKNVDMASDRTRILRKHLRCGCM